MVQEAAFPRGRPAVTPAEQQQRRDAAKKKRNPSRSTPRDDLLFGDSATIHSHNQQRNKKQKTTTTTHTKSMLPLGGGGINLKRNTIERLTFSNLSTHMKVLAVVRHVVDGAILLSLPHSWTGYAMNEHNLYRVSVHQVLSVKITKLVSETTKVGVQKRRIQVSFLPQDVNGSNLQHTNAIVRGIVKSVEDHGYLMDLGRSVTGFLPFDDDNSGDEWTVHQVVDVQVKEQPSMGGRTTVLQLQRPRWHAKVAAGTNVSMHELNPGLYLDTVVVEHHFGNGLGVTFGGFRAAIEDVHLPKKKKEHDSWYKRHPTVQARVLAVDPTTKIIRLTLLPHLVRQDWQPATFPVSVGDVLSDAAVVRLDAGLGALLEVPEDTTAELDPMLVEGVVDEETLEREQQQQDSASRYVYVHISNAMDNADSTLDTVFNKAFAVQSTHTVRILKTSNLLEGIMVGGTANTIVQAHVLSYDDLQPGQLFKQVPIIANLNNGNCLVDFGRNIKALLSSTHMFDQVTTHDYRAQLQKVKFAVGSRVDVRILQVDAPNRKCTVTAKKSLVKVPESTILTNYEDARVGKLYPGFVTAVSEQGIAVTFFNNVFGRVSAKSLALDMGVENIQETYKEGDVVSCRVVHVKTIKRKNVSQEDDEEVPSDTGRGCYYELSLSLKVDGEDGMDIDQADSQVKLKLGTVLPLKSLRVMELVKGKNKRNAYVPGHSVVRIKTKYIAETVEDSLPEFIDCKLPYDLLLDSYEPDDVETVEDLDELAGNMLTIGKKINRKAVVWRDPQKSIFQYKSGTGALPVVSIKAGIIEAAEAQAVNSESARESIQLPGPDSHYYVGAQLRGTVGTIDPRHGAFVRFLNGMSGLVPKRMGGMHLQLFSTVTVRVEAVDDKLRPPKILLGLPKRKLKPTKKSNAEPDIGDVVHQATVADIDRYRAYLKVHDDEWGEYDVSVRLHCSMASPVEQSPDKKDDSGIVPPSHPFSRLSKGSSLEGLRVVAVRAKGNKTFVDVTTMDEVVSFTEDESQLSPGDTVSGVISTVSCSGIGLQISPYVHAHLPAIEASKDLKVLNNLEEHFPVGRRLECIVMKHAKSSKTRNNSEKKAKVLNLSLVAFGKKGTLTRMPKLGEIVLGRINKNTKHVSASEVGIDLRGGYAGRCCITELADPLDWVTYPLGQPKTFTPSSPDSDDSSLFAHGRFVKCRVLAISDNGVEVSLRPSRLNGDGGEDKEPEVGQSIQAYVVETNKKGCFLQIGRKIAGMTKLKLLSDSFLPNPAETFRRGRLVVGMVTGVRRSKAKKLLVDVDMRGSKLMDSSVSIAYKDVEIGSKYKATVTRVEDYGVFVRLHGSDVSGLVHKSECSDDFVKNPSDLYREDDLVKVVVLKKDEAKKQVGFSMKASHFEGDEESDDESSEDESPVHLSVSDDKAAKEVADSEDENFGTKLASDINSNQVDSESDADSSDESSESGSDTENESNSSTSDDDGESEHLPALDTNVGFDWDGQPKLHKATQDESDESDSSDEDERAHKSSHKSRKKQAKRREEEREIARREIALADGTADENPETSADFERLLASDPNSSELWIRFMAFHLGLANVSAAREVANRAFSRIEFRREEERLNVWCALLTLELKYGSDDTLQPTLDRACQHNNPKNVYLRMCEILEKHSINSAPEAVQKTDEMFAKMCKKFRSKKKVWIAYMEYLLKNARHEEAYSLSKRCLQSLKPHKHVETMSKFAQLMFQYGNAEKARTIFEGLLAKYQKRLDLLFVYTDMEVKFGDVHVARSLYERVANANHEALIMKLTDQKMKKLFKKWFAFEGTYGNAETQDRVKASAKAYVEQT